MLAIGVRAQTTTQIVDTVLSADGTPFNGTVVITWTGGTAGNSPAPYSTSARIYNGALSVSLVPSVASASSAFYVATFNSRDGLTSWVETWQVGPSSTPLTLAQVRTTLPSGGSSGASTISIGQVTGLSSYLNALSTSLNTTTSSFSGFNATLAGLSTSVANLNTTVNNVVNNSSSSPSAGSSTPGFIDNEVPQGTIDGTNAVFLLTNGPNPAASLNVFLNGILQVSGIDYSLSSNKITFTPGSRPHLGDILQAFYRLGSSTTITFVDAAAPSGTMNGTNQLFTLPSTPNPAGSLKVYRNGILLMPNLDYTLNGSAISFGSAAATPVLGDSILGFYRVTNP